MTSEEAMRIRAERDRYLEAQGQTREATRAQLTEMLEDTHRQSIPAGAEFYRMHSDADLEVPEDARQMGEVKPPEQPSSSSSGIGGAIASGASAVGSPILDAGKEAVKTAEASGVQNAIMGVL